ncbi:hypothetical protein Q5424_13700 [Conexibacter sp. JD483]|uniref:hypothetical protein n=1 Tax=unclassified Conexibacter TaxID=2627773 RepID=UPI00272575C6|nr:MULTISPECIES: hypothetical protein [unclassified Conexibacter]MDO8188271.1 hypothetical protein [Conexibacter sp. CPCC 205706]MDO8197374.1 hypothetical protein [Conexibacter sp. CPCC 205762]MDR9370150.1 hypothetical protein [Conexibacter sp. JD483]
MLAGLIAPSAAGAATVANGGFERSAAADRAFTSQNDPLPVSGWDFWDPRKLVAPVADPFSGQATVLGTWTPPREAYPTTGVPEGSAVGFVYVAGGPGRGELGLRQQTRLRLTAGTRYILEVAIGNPRSDDVRGFSVGGFPGYRIELRAGGHLLAKEVDRVKPADGSFAETAIAYTARARDRGLGARIEIRLVNRNARVGAEVDFDSVRLATARAAGDGAGLGTSKGSGGVAGVVESGGGPNAGSNGGAGVPYDVAEGLAPIAPTVPAPTPTAPSSGGGVSVPSE